MLISMSSNKMKHTMAFRDWMKCVLHTAHVAKHTYHMVWLHTCTSFDIQRQFWCLSMIKLFETKILSYQKLNFVQKKKKNMDDNFIYLDVSDTLYPYTHWIFSWFSKYGTEIYRIANSFQKKKYIYIYIYIYGW